MGLDIIFRQIVGIKSVKSPLSPFKNLIALLLYISWIVWFIFYPQESILYKNFWISFQHSTFPEICFRHMHVPFCK